VLDRVSLELSSGMICNSFLGICEIIVSLLTVGRKIMMKIPPKNKSYGESGFRGRHYPPKDVTAQ
jgi:hypothetical protein